MKWEYFVKDIASDMVNPEGQMAMLSHFGKQEWELVSVSGVFAYFKRPLRTKSEAEILAHFDYPQQDRSSEV